MCYRSWRIGVLIMLFAVLLNAGHSGTRAGAADPPKLDDRIVQLDKRLAQLEKVLFELQQSLKDKPLSETAMDQGEVLVLANDQKKDGETEVYYRMPFASPPKITIVESKWNEYVISVQKADSFKIINKHERSDRIKWKAEGAPAREKPKDPPRP